MPKTTNGTCESCYFEDIEVKEYPDEKNNPIKLCGICAGSLLSKSITYPSLYNSDTRLICSSVGWIANKILQEIKNAKAN